MIRDHLRRSRSLRKLALVSTILSSFALVVAVPAMANQAKGIFAVFNECPVVNPEVNICFVSKTGGGEFDLGKAKIPITSTITLQGGIILNEATEKEVFVGAENGETLSKTPLIITGGLLSVVDPKGFPKALKELFNKYVSKGLTGVTATAELVEEPTINRPNLLFGEGTALTLALRFHLNNPFLGKACYIGSKAHPVTLPLTTGTTNPPPPNKPTTGNPGELETHEFPVDIIKGNKLVENAFSVPGVEGCGGIYSFIVDPVIDAKLGLPSAAGHNTAILENTLYEATAEDVKNSE